jgi:tRNA U34 5-carboxymethylaminomethyl modifying GTPase MnmE/TrmE
MPGKDKRPAAIAIGDAVFAAKHGRPLAAVATHTVQYGWVRDSSGAGIDEVLVTVMRAPRTYTRKMSSRSVVTEAWLPFARCLNG